MKREIILLLMLIGLLAMATGANALLGSTVFNAPANNSIQSGALSINWTTANAGGGGYTNATLRYQSTVNTTLQTINITITNATENQTDWKLNFTTSNIQDSNVSFVVNMTYNNGTAETQGATVRGIIINNTQSASTLSSPASGTTSETGSQNFTVTTNELYNNLRIYLNGQYYSMTANANNNSWNYTATNLADGVYGWYVIGDPLDGDDGELNPLGAAANEAARRSLIVTVSTGSLPTVLAATAQQQAAASAGSSFSIGNISTSFNNKNVQAGAVIIGIGALLYYAFRKRRR